VNPTRLYTLEEAANACGRAYQLLRFYYAQGLLPDPINTTGSAKYKVRMFTYLEVRKLKDFFKTVQPGTISRVRRSLARKKKRSYADGR
jgi:hypothetical protein